MAADGAIVFSTEIDDKQAQAELKKLEAQIEKLNQKIYDKNQAKLPLVEQAKQLGAELDAAKAKLEDMRNGTSFYYTASQIKAQEKEVRELDKQFNSVNDKIDKIGASINSDTQKVDKMRERVGELAGQLAGANQKTKGMSDAAQQAAERMDKFSQHVKTLAKRVLVFSLITAGLRALKNYLWEAIQQNDEAVAAIARLKGALMTLAQPIVDVVIPAFTVLINVLTRIVNAVSRLISALFGTTVQKSAQAAKALNAQKNGIEGVGDAAKEATRYLAGFDELNTLPDNSSGSTGSGGGGASGGIAPDFTSSISDQISAIVELFTGAALLGLGAILTFSGVNIPLGIALMVLGAIALWDSVTENWDAIKELLQGTTLGMAALLAGLVLVVLGILLAFSGVSIPFGIGLILAGAAVLAPAVAANWEALKPQILKVLYEILTIGTPLLLAIGLTLVLTGVNLPLGIGLLIVGAAGLAAIVAINWDSIVTALQGPIGKIVAIVSGALLVLGIILCLTGVGIPLGLGLILVGAAGLAAAIVPNWDFIKDKCAEIWNSVKNWWNTNVKQYFTAEWWSNLGRRAIDGLLSGLKSAWQAVTSWISNAVNWVANAFNNLFGGGRTQSSGGGRSVEPFSAQAMPALKPAAIPALARGAVIPPNREFLAVLGDQKRGTNVEAPADLIRQIVREEVGNSGGEEITIKFAGDLAQLARILSPEITRQQRRSQRAMGV